MIQISTQNHCQLLLENLEDPLSSLNQDEQKFYTAIEKDLNKEIREPHPSTIERIMAFSKKISE